MVYKYVSEDRTRRQDEGATPMQTTTATRTTRASLDTMVRIETDTLNWQRENDQGYTTIMATMARILDLNRRIEATMGNRPSSYATNVR